MKRFDTIEGIVEYTRRLRREGRTIGFVPTMGALHEGHLSLAREAVARHDVAVVSIFVNPLQFGPDEDFETYPRDLDADCARLEAAGVDAVFTTTPAEMYPEGYRTHVVVEELPETLCGRFRPVHFRGVTTVVTKLFHIVRPHAAYFGQKDAQQCIVLRRMVEDLNFDLALRALPTVREPDGLALSSRNAYLSAEERPKALALHRALAEARRLFEAGERRSAAILEAMDRIFAAVPALRVEYRQIVDLETLRDLDRIEDRALAAVAARLGGTRLIDNTVLGADRLFD
jgi:pantoate--beta-alanine ligase